MLEINWQPSQRDLKQFAGIWLPLAIAMLGAMLWYKGGYHTAAMILWGVGAVVSVLSWVFPPVAKAVFVGWMVAAYPIGWTVSHLLMGLIYFGLITPMGLAMRLFGRDAMGRKWHRDATTYWTPHETTTDPKRYFRQY